jgi:hypothetical protein
MVSPGTLSCSCSRIDVTAVVLLRSLRRSGLVERQPLLGEKLDGFGVGVLLIAAAAGIWQDEEGFRWNRSLPDLSLTDDRAFAIVVPVFQQSDYLSCCHTALSLKFNERSVPVLVNLELCTVSVLFDRTSSTVSFPALEITEQPAISGSCEKFKEAQSHVISQGSGRVAR